MIKSSYSLTKRLDMSVAGCPSTNQPLPGPLLRRMVISACLTNHSIDIAVLEMWSRGMRMLTTTVVIISVTLDLVSQEISATIHMTLI